MGSWLPDSPLPAECHLVLRPDVSVRSISPPGLPLLLPQHCSGPPHYYTTLHTCQKGQCRSSQVILWSVPVCSSLTCVLMSECCAKGQKESGRCLRLSQCCTTSSSSSPDSVKGAALRSNSRYTNSQSRRATANRQVCNSSLPLRLNQCEQVFNTALYFLCFCSRVESEGCGTTPFADKLSLLSLLRTLLTLLLSTEVKFVCLITPRAEIPWGSGGS